MRSTTPRVLVLASGMICLLVTPPLALAYVGAYGQSSGESAPSWIEALDWLGFVSGPDAVATYNRYGLIYGVSLLVLTVALASIAMGRGGVGDWERLGSWTMLAGLGAVAVGAMAEYGIPEDTADASWGFGLELLGFVALIVGAVILGYAGRAERSVRTPFAVAVGASGLVGVVAGAAIVGHLPSGPALLFVIAAMVIAITGVPRREPNHEAAVE